MEKTKFNDEIEKLFAECINWAITGPESWHFRATNLMSEMNHEVRRLAAENENYKKLANEAITNEEMETHAADQMSMQVDTLLTKVNRMYEANVKLSEELAVVKTAIKNLGPILNSSFDKRSCVNREALKKLQEISGVTIDEYT